MSLTTNDLQQIRSVVREEVRDELASQLTITNEKIDKLDGRVQALENDVKEIYVMV